MRDARYLREQARRCRDLLRTAIEPGLIEQLRLWSVELADEADEIVRRASSARKTPRRSSPVRSSAKPTLAIVKRAFFSCRQLLPAEPRRSEHRGRRSSNRYRSRIISERDGRRSSKRQAL